MRDLIRLSMLDLCVALQTIKGPFEADNLIKASYGALRAAGIAAAALRRDTDLLVATVPLLHIRWAWLHAANSRFPAV